LSQKVADMAVSALINLSALLDDAGCFGLVRQQRWPHPPGPRPSGIRRSCAPSPILRQRSVALVSSAGRQDRGRPEAG
jgi:hypothetical protein